MEQFTTELLGGIGAPIWLAWILFGLIGSLTAIFVRAWFKFEESKETPNKWSWGFLFRDNGINIIISILMVFIYVRFSQDLLGKEATGFLSLITGATANELSLKFVKWSSNARRK